MLPPAVKSTEKALFKTQATVSRYAGGAWGASQPCDVAVVQDQATSEFRCLVVSRAGVPISNHLVHPVSVVHSPSPTARALWVQDWLADKCEEACIELTFTQQALAVAFEGSYALAQREMAQLHAATKAEWGAVQAQMQKPIVTPPKAAAPAAASPPTEQEEDEEEEDDDDEDDDEDEEDEEEEQEETHPAATPANKPAQAWNAVAPGTWKCRECFLQNKPDAVKCASCDSPKPGASSSAMAPTAAAPTAAASAWTCSACKSSNAASAATCEVCDADRPAAAKPAPATPSAAAAAAPTFNFAAAVQSATSAAASTPAPKFSFAGAVPPPSSEASKPFAFAPVADSKLSAPPVFAAPTQPPQPPQPAPAPAQTENKPPAAFSFSGTPKQPPTAADSKAPPAGAFNFSAFANVVPSGNGGSGAAAAVATPAKPVEFPVGTPSPPNFALLQGGKPFAGFGAAQVSPSPTLAPTSFAPVSTPAAAATPAPQPKAAAAPNGSGAQQQQLSPKERVERFYRQHNPDKMEAIPGLLEKYRGKEEQLYAKLMDKYQLAAFDDAFPPKQVAAAALHLAAATAASDKPKFGQTAVLSAPKGDDVRPQARPLTAAEEAAMQSVTGGFASHAKSTGGFGSLAAQGKSAFN